MRRFLRAIGWVLETVTESYAWFLICVALGTLGFTIAIARHFAIPALTLKFMLVEIGSVILAFVLWLILTFIFFCISSWIERYI